MPSVLSAAIKKRSSDLTVGAVNWTDVYVVKCDPNIIQGTVETYFRTTLLVYPGKLVGTTSYCDKVTFNSVTPDGQLWEAVATYAPVTWTIIGNPTSISPLDEPWSIRFGRTPLSQVLEKAYAKWLDGEAVGTSVSPPAELVINSAGDPFDPPLMQDIKLTTIELEKNVSIATFTGLFTGGYDDSVNSAGITVCGITIPTWGGRVSIEGARATYPDPSTSTLKEYMHLRCVVTIHPQTWVRFVIDQGLKGKEPGGGGVVIRAREVGYADKSADTPLKLNGNGYFKSGTDNSTTYLAFLTYNPVAWSGLSLPNSLSM